MSWSGCWDFDNNVSWLSYYLSFESLLGIGCVGDRSDETVGIDDRVAALDHVAVSRFFAILIVGELVVFYVESKLVGRVLLRKI